MLIISLKEVPKFIRVRINIPDNLPSKQELSVALSSLIGDFFSSHTLQLNEQEVRASYSDIPEWRIDTVMAKLRSLMEQKAKKEVRIFCSNLDIKRKNDTNLLLRKAGIYNFRSSIELDLYVGVHTAISAYFKMIGVALFASRDCDPAIPLQQSSKELFKVLNFAASLPLRYLMAVDGLFWDSKQYAIPKLITSEIVDSNVLYFIDSEELEKRLQSVRPDEEPTGCPALRARTDSGRAVFELVENYCLECVDEFFLKFER